MRDTEGVRHVIGPDGERMTRADLPSPHTERWIPHRKACVVAAVEGGLITREHACERYGLSAEEYESWKAALARGGLKELRVTRLREARQGEGSRKAPRVTPR